MLTCSGDSDDGKGSQLHHQSNLTCWLPPEHTPQAFSFLQVLLGSARGPHGEVRDGNQEAESDWVAPQGLDGGVHSALAYREDDRIVYYY